MKKIISLLLLSVLIFSTFAYCADEKMFSASSSTVVSSEVVLGFPPASGARTIVYLQATSDLTTEGIDFLTLASSTDAKHTVDASSASGAKVIYLASTTGLTVNDLVMLWNRSTNACEVHKIASISAGVSISVFNNLANTYDIGDKCYELSVNGTLDNNGSTASQGSEYWSDRNLWNSESWTPLAIKTGVTSAGNILASGYMNVN